MKIIKRTIQDSVEKSFFKGKVVIVYGARQVGKTTLIKEIQNKHSANSIYLNCDEPDIRKAFTNVTSTEIKSFVGDKKFIFLDEAQRVKNIGLSLKLIIDNFPKIQVVAAGSSSFDLSNEISEPLTGRKKEFYLYPFSLRELRQFYPEIDMERLLEKRILLGMYPEMIQKSDSEAESSLKSLAGSYLYKDVLGHQDIKNSEIIEKLLQALALQVGNEVSYNELANIIGINKKTVANYIQILEKAFIVFRLRPFRRNLRKELSKLRKIYFFDTGIRNALINNFNSFTLRQDVGALWENFLLSERMKVNNNSGKSVNTYFWRTHQQEEIDYLEEARGKILGFEFKWQDNKFHIPKAFRSAYPKSTVKLVTRKNNLREFLGLNKMK